jgi:D-alanine-D-alanine ligase
MRLVMRKNRIGILLGGLNAERGISLETGHAVYDALRERGYDVQRIFVDHDLDQALRQCEIDVAFLALNGQHGENGCVQGMLEMMGIPFTGSGVMASSIAMNKIKSKELFRLHNIPTPPYYIVDDSKLDELEEVHGAFGYPVVVKPASAGSRTGVEIARSFIELQSAVVEALQFDEQVLIERYAHGMAVSVAIIDDRVLGAVEIELAGEIRTHIPARLNPVRYQGILNLARKAAKSLSCSGVCRVDLIVTEGDNEYVLEVDTLPGMTPTSLVPMVAASIGMDFGDLCEMIVEGARTHIGRRRQRVTTTLRRESPAWTESPHLDA